MRPDDPRHGTSAGYIAGCRCTPCSDAKLRYDKQRRLELFRTGQARKVPAIGPIRRLQALQRLGWSIPAIAQRMGVTDRALYGVGRHSTVYRSTAQWIADIYDELSMTLPPATTPNERHSATKARNHATQQGWPPPLAWDDIDDANENPEGAPMQTKSELDPIVVERIISGDYRMPATDPERLEVIRIWQADGIGNNEIVRRTGWNIWRYLRLQREAS